MTRLRFAAIPEKVARNPVAQALRRDELRRVARDLLLAMHLADDGSEQAGVLADAALLLSVGSRLVEAEHRALVDAAAFVVDEMATAGRWRCVQANLVDDGVSAALQAINAASNQALWVACASASAELRTRAR